MPKTPSVLVRLKVSTMYAPNPRLLDTTFSLDPSLLEQASAILGTPTKKATVNEALRRVVQSELRRAHLHELATGSLPDLSDPQIMDSA